MEYFKRENATLAYEWSVTKYENNEPDLPEYTRRTRIREEKLANANLYLKLLLRNEKYFKILFSYLVLLFMVDYICFFVNYFKKIIVKNNKLKT